jgi:integrase
MMKHKDSMGWSLHKQGNKWYVRHRLTPDGKPAGKSTGETDKEKAYEKALEIIRVIRRDQLIQQKVQSPENTGMGLDITGFASVFTTTYEQMEKEAEILLPYKLDETNPRLSILWVHNEDWRLDGGLIVDILRELNTSPTSYNMYRCRWNNFVNFLNEKYPKVIRVKQITKDMCNEFLSTKSTLKETTRINYVTVIRKVFSILIEKGKCEYIPMPTVKRVVNRQNKKIVIPKIITEEQETILRNILMDYPDKSYLYLFEIALKTGMRKGEVVNLLWDNIHLENKKHPFIVIQPNDKVDDVDEYQLKTQRSTRTTPIKKSLIPILNSIPKTGPYVINPTLHSFRRYTFEFPEGLRLKLQNKKTGVSHFTPHTLRHTFISRALMAGNAPIEVALWVGDSVQMILQTYTHIIPTGNIDNF